MRRHGQHLDCRSLISYYMIMNSILLYTTKDGKQPFDSWLRKLRDRQAEVAILRRVARLKNDNFGVNKFLGNGVWELKINLGPGYRVYYAIEANTVILLLCGGDKSTQSDDIKKAESFLTEWKSRRT